MQIFQRKKLYLSCIIKINVVPLQRNGLFLFGRGREQAMLKVNVKAIHKAMKIFIQVDKRNKKYVPEIMSALQKAGHQLILSNDCADVQKGLQSCHVSLYLAPAGMKDDKESIDRPFVRTEVDLRVRKMVQVIGESALPRRQILAALGLKQQSRRNFIYNYLKPSVAQGYVTMSYPGVPNKPEQTYKLTGKGLDLYDKLLSN